MSEMDFQKEAKDLVEWLGSFGADAVTGVTRLLYDEEWVKAQNALKDLFQNTGLTARYDEIGNLYAKLEGSKYKDETIATGSHVDSVTLGGRYDGAFGIIAGFIATKYLKETYGQPLRNIEIVSIAEEEGSRFPFTFWGSKNIIGQVRLDEIQDIKDNDGVSLIDAMEQAGFGIKSSHKGIPKDWKNWIEVHIEQGAVLEIEKIPVGIVQHIAGQRRYTVELTGQANHAGTTPMKYRKDAGVTTAEIMKMINEKAWEYGEPMVATVGSIEFIPGTVNVIPGKAKFTIDVRHTQKEAIISFTEEMEEEMKKIAAASDIGIEINLYMDEEPVPMSLDVVEKIKKQCDAENIVYKLMHSGAGHDTQNIAPLIPSAMIFVQSRAGISHNPAEFTDPVYLSEGIKVLANTLYELAYKEEN